MKTNTIHTGDCIDVLLDVPANSVHAVVTDPPYGLAFMGKSWDDFAPKEYQEWCEEWAREVKRVLKPGGHLLAFSGNRTHHRLFSGVEDAGFEIRDTITWHYGSGFPKALDVSKAIDKQAGKKDEREVVAEEPPEHLNGGAYTGDGESDKYGDGLNTRSKSNNITAPATDAAKKWDGFKTALKPATEYVVVARKDLSEGTVAENVQAHGTGALNIDGTRIETDGRPQRKHTGKDHENKGGMYRQNSETSKLGGECYADGTSTEGRYPANVVFDELEAERLDRDVGELAAGARTPQTNSGSGDIYGEYADDTREHERQQLESGGPSRYFYTSKATKAERTLDGKINNDHPTVKPQDLMEWLVTLVTAEEQIVLDPFIGSGTTGMACKELNRQFIGIEQNERYADIARVRCGLTPEDPSVVREDDTQTGLGSF